MGLGLDVIMGPVGVTKSTLFPTYLFWHIRSDKNFVSRLSVGIVKFYSLAMLGTKC